MNISYSFIVCLVILACLTFDSKSQNTGLSKYIHLEPASEGSGNHYLELSSDVDSTWWRWQYRGYNFGFHKRITPMYTTINGILSMPYTIQVRENEDERNKKRWGYHVFEGYARDDKSRITMFSQSPRWRGLSILRLQKMTQKHKTV